MKKSFKLILSLIMTALLLLAVGCSGSTEIGGESIEAPEDEPIFITMGTGTTGGSYYPLGGAMAKIWTDNIPNVHASVQSTGGTNQNIQLMADNQSEVGFTDTKYVLAYDGVADWEGNPQTWLRGLLPLKML